MKSCSLYLAAKITAKILHFILLKLSCANTLISIPVYILKQRYTILCIIYFFSDTLHIIALRSIYYIFCLCRNKTLNNQGFQWNKANIICFFTMPVKGYIWWWILIKFCNDCCSSRVLEFLFKECQDYIFHFCFVCILISSYEYLEHHHQGSHDQCGIMASSTWKTCCTWLIDHTSSWHGGDNFFET